MNRQHEKISSWWVSCPVKTLGILRLISTERYKAEFSKIEVQLPSKIEKALKDSSKS